MAHPRTDLVAGVDPDARAASVSKARAERCCHPSLATPCRTRGRGSRASALLPRRTSRSWCELLEAGVEAVWCEKPLAATPEDGRELVRACEERGVPLQVNFLRRFDPLHRALASELADVRLHADFRFSGSLGTTAVTRSTCSGGSAGELESVLAVPRDEGGPAVLARAERGSTATFLPVSNTAADVFDAMIYAADSRITLSCLGEELGRATPVNSDALPGIPFAASRGLEARQGLSDAMTNGVRALIDHIETDAPSGATGPTEWPRC